jgi:beta-lactamase regulating signal transducer with metallopeptidase domain
MTALQNWLTPEVTRAAALAILHFLWQGAALAALASAAMAVFRNALTRYVIAVAFLAAMIAAPLLTFAILKRQPEPTAPSARVTLFESTTAEASAQISFVTDARARAQNPSRAGSLPWLPLLVEAWLLGVVLLSLRPAVGFVLVERLRRYEAKPIAAELRVRCLTLERRLGITRVIRYFESRNLQTPAAVGWFRPVIFLPLSAITGLSPGQLDAVIAHELAHIKRLDSFVNLFQIAVETLLFYHPAVWWLSKRIRAERENCCDDVALSVCADPAAYARALASMAEWQTAPALAMAANRRPLAARVARILGAAKLQAGIRGASLAASALCLTASLVAGHALFGSHRETSAPPASAVTNSGASANSAASASALAAPLAPSSEGDDPTIVVTAPSPALNEARGHVPPPPDSPAETAEQENSPQPKSPQPKNNNDASAPQSSYIEALKSVGLDHLSVDELIALKIQGVTADYVRELHALDLHPDVDDIIAMKIQGITPLFLKELSEQGLKSDVSDAIALKIQGVTPEYVRELRATFPDISSDDLLAMKVQGVKPEYVREMREVTATKLHADEIIAMKVQGVSPEYVRSLQSLNLKLDADDVIAMKVQGVTAEYVKSLEAAGLHFDAEELIGAKVQGITPEFIERVRKMGFQNLDLDKLMQLKTSGVLE